MSAWIDFKELRSRIPFSEVLRHYAVEVKAKGNQHLGFCPLPDHQGNRRSPSFSANLDKGIFNCFGCGAKGNMIDFAVRMERLNPDSGSDVRKAALILAEHFHLSDRANQAPKKQVKEKRKEDAQREFSVVVNAPLDFELKRLDENHPYLIGRGFTPETIQYFGLGYCAKGLFSGRVAIPIHKEDGTLVGYAGRIVDETKIGEDHPKYKFPPKREHDGKLYEFHKLKLLYNAHRIKKPVNDLIVVEGFPSVWYFTQRKYENVVALMGSALSDDQSRIIEQLLSSRGRIWLIPDGDAAGLRCAESALPHLAQVRSVQWLKLDEGKQPTDYAVGFFEERFSQ